jgi:hypothetical protein
LHQIDDDVAESDAAEGLSHLPGPLLDDLRAKAASDADYAEFII